MVVSSRFRGKSPVMRSFEDGWRAGFSETIPAGHFARARKHDRRNVPKPECDSGNKKAVWESHNFVGCHNHFLETNSRTRLVVTKTKNKNLQRQETYLWERRRLIVAYHMVCHSDITIGSCVLLLRRFMDANILQVKAQSRM